MKKIVLLFGLSFLAFSCSQATKIEVTAENKTPIEQNENLAKIDAHKSVVPNTVFDAEISGMDCVMGCGSAIRRNLYKDGGVAKVEYDFDETREKNGIKVFYDNSKISEKDILAALKTMDDGKYKIYNPKSEDYKN